MKVLKKCWLKKLKSFNFVLIEKKRKVFEKAAIE